MDTFLSKVANSRDILKIKKRETMNADIVESNVLTPQAFEKIVPLPETEPDRT
jgi:hypothetical protein